MNEQTKHTSGYLFFEKIILDSIDLSGYDIDDSDMNDFHKIAEVDKIFKSEYDWNISRLGYKKAFTEYLQGLPSCITVPFENYKILEAAKKGGFYFESEEAEYEFLNSWFSYCASAFYTMSVFTRV